MSFSIETVIVGRNDNYEPNWSERLFSVIEYNSSLFRNTAIDYKVVFIEWNPIEDKPLLSEKLVDTFPFLRAIVVDANVHNTLRTCDNLQMMLNFPINAGIRSSKADYILITGGDGILSQDLVNTICARGLRRKCLYRAERVNIRNDLDFSKISTEILENKNNIVSIDSCKEPPYNIIPYTNSCGDFILLDRISMQGLRGFDENITFARTHLDTRFCLTAILAGFSCELLGQIYHIDHAHSMVNMGDKYSTISTIQYGYQENLPYLNSIDWGLKKFNWTLKRDRLYQVSLPIPQISNTLIQRSNILLEAADINQINAVTSTLINSYIPPKPLTNLKAKKYKINRKKIFKEKHWEKISIFTRRNFTYVRTGPNAWSYTLFLPNPLSKLNSKCWTWICFSLEVKSGTIGIGLLYGNELVNEKIISQTQGEINVYLSLKDFLFNGIIIRNCNLNGTFSKFIFRDISVVEQKKKNFANTLLEYEL